MPKKSAQGKSTWRSDQQNHKVKQKVRLALLVLLSVVLLIIVGQAVKVVTSFHKPLDLGISESHQIWDGKYPLNLVVETSSISLVNFDPTQGKIIVVDIKETDSTAGGLSKGELQKKLAQYLGIPIDGYIGLSSNFSTYSPIEVVEKLKTNPIEWFLNLKSIRSDLTPKELLKLSISFPRVRFDKVKRVEIEGDLDLFVSKNFSDNQIRNEQATIAIFNATDTPGLAQKAARIVTNLGGNVIIVTSAETKNLKVSYIFAKDDAPSYTRDRITTIFAPNCPTGTGCDILEDSDITGSRAQINIVLGQDFINRF